MSEQLSAGPDLDRRITQQLGWTEFHLVSSIGASRWVGKPPNDQYAVVPAVSTDWAAFGWLLGEMERLGFQWELIYFRNADDRKYLGIFKGDGNAIGTERGSTILEAAAHAALVALKEQTNGV